jgi:hypothetical protein
MPDGKNPMALGCGPPATGGANKIKSRPPLHASKMAVAAA